MTLALVCLTMLAGLTACGDDIDKGGKPHGEIDQALIGEWVFDHCNVYVAPGGNKAKWLFQSNGVCQYSDVAAPKSYFYTASNGRLILETTYDRTITMYYTMKDGLVAIYANADDDLDKVTYYRRSEKSQTEKKEVTFTVENEMSQGQQMSMDVPLSKATITADGKQMTDLWVLDYMGGELKQQVHQVSTDEDFGEPRLALDYGEHQIYFVCSRGKTPTLSTEDKTLVWATPSDTFWRQVAMNVTAASAAQQNVTLQRVATKLNITIQDAIPEGLATVSIVPDTWYYGLNYQTGEPTNSSNSEIVFNIPASKVGTQNLNLATYGMSATTEWTTDIAVTAKSSTDAQLGLAAIHNAPFKRNRVTNYTGNLFAGGASFGLTLNDVWDEAVNNEW